MIGNSVDTAAAWLNKGEVVAIPTETVYGLAANIFSEKAVKKIFKIKNRPLSNPLIVHVANIKRARSLVTEFPTVAEKLATAFWPGPLTMILPKQEMVSGLITAEQDTVAIRIPDHPVALALLKRLDFPLAAPSANKFSYISPVTAEAVEEMLGDQLEYILDGGPCSKGIESTIVAFEGDSIRILRPGAITEEQLTSVIHQPLNREKNNDIAHPGQCKKHYSPRTPLILTDNIAVTFQQVPPLKIALISFNDPYVAVRADKKIMLSASSCLEEAARHLYKTLYELDKEGYDLIIAEKLPDRGVGRAVNDRLMKAAEPF